MGAGIVHGKALVKVPYLTTTGDACFEVFPQEGDFDSASYSTIEETVRHCERWGVPRGSWPIYYGIWQGDADLEEAGARCRDLAIRLESVPQSERWVNRFLANVNVWLDNGEVFCIWD